MTRRKGWALLASAALVASCHPRGAEFPWTAPVEPAAAEHAYVLTRNPDYDRLRSHVLVREITRPTRAALDYAAYHANFMIADPPPERLPKALPVSASHPFDGLLDPTTFTGDIAKTALTEAERHHGLAFAPLAEFLLANRTDGAERLEELGSAVRSETWGQPATPGQPPQTISEVLLHRPAPARAELWVKIEFAPWFRGLGELPDQDRDGVPELYARARPDRLADRALEVIERDYAGRELGPAEITAWANQLSSYWYPSFNTDLLPPGKTWPDEQTEPDIVRELRGRTFSAPTIVLRGKPQGRPTYEVLLVRMAGASRPEADVARATGKSALQLPKTNPTPDASPIARAVRRELEQHGAGSWTAWAQSLAPFQGAVRKRIATTPRGVQAVPGIDGFLFYRKSLEFVAGGDLEQQPRGKNPLPIIVEYKEKLAALGVDFLFVPVPTKAEVFPDKLDSGSTKLAGQIVNPWSRKLLLSLAEQGVEVIDLLTPFLGDRARADTARREHLFQRQDTHWTAGGLELAAGIIAARIARYPWYAALAKHAQPFKTHETAFTRFGDLHSRLPEALKKQYHPETLMAHQVLHADGTAYEDAPDSPIVVLGDSFTGVYQLTDAEHAGLSAHIARNISHPIDLVMSYGGGPNVRNKLMRRGPEALASKRLVVWVMAARDLYAYWEDWEPLKSP